MGDRIGRSPKSALLFVPLLFGCGSSGPARFAVSGVVTFDGAPLVDGEIQFRPDAATKGPSIAGRIENGAYAIPAERGPVAGAYTISISAERPTGRKVRADILGEATTDQYEQYVPPRYNAQSTLRAEVDSDQDDMDFELESM